MTFKWDTKPLGALLELVIDHRGKTPNKMGFEDFHSDGHPVLSAKHVKTDELVNTEAMRFANEHMYKKWMKIEIQEGDIALTSEAPMGEVFYLDGKVKYVLGQRVFGLRAKRELIDPLYLTAWLTSRKGQEQLAARASGSTVIGIKQSELLKIDVDVPPLYVQVQIAKIRYDLSKKIQLNRQTNQTLEHIAQAIFKSWFVDFEPTRAKIAAKKKWLATNKKIECSSPTCYADQFEDNNPPDVGLDEAMTRAAMCVISGKTPEQLDAHGRANAAGTGSAGAADQINPETQQQLKTTAALFPDALVESELGEIPEGWEIGTLDDLCNLNAKSWTTKNAPNEVWYIDLANTKNGTIEEVQHYKWDESPSRARRIVSPGDTIIGTVRPGNRSFSLIGSGEKQLTSSTGFAVLTPKKLEYTQFIYIAATSDSNIERLAHLADGAAYPAVRPDIVTQMGVAIPDDDIFTRFSDLVRSMFLRKENNFEQNAILADCRDSLLPRLLSGEITIGVTRSTASVATILKSAVGRLQG